MSKRVQRDFTDDFKREAVRLTQTSGRTIRQRPLWPRVLAPPPVQVAGGGSMAMRIGLSASMCTSRCGKAMTMPASLKRL